MSLKNRHFLKLLDFTPEEITAYLDLAAELKAAKKAGREVQRMKGKNIALIFEKTSTRTRCAFEVAARDQGAGVTYLEPSASQIGHKESIKDTARVLGRMFDGIEYRGFGQDVVEELAKYAGVPVFNGLTNEFHPTQMLADALTMREHSDKPLNQIAFAYVVMRVTTWPIRCWCWLRNWAWMCVSVRRKVCGRLKTLSRRCRLLPKRRADGFC